MRRTIPALAAIAGTLIVSAPTAQAHGVEMMTTRHGVFISTDMPHCTNEDGSGGPRPCTWNVGTPKDGNGEGLAYWIGKAGHAHYIWTTSPLPGHPHRAWVTRRQAVDFARHADGPHRTRAQWRQCFVHYGSAANCVVCADGDWYSTS